MIHDEKKKLRQQIRLLKKELSNDDRLRKSQVVFNQVEESEEFKKADTILAYWSMADEVYTHDFVNKWYKLKTIILPSVNGSVMELKKYSGPESLRKGDLYGIEEPIGELFAEINLIDLAIIPGIAFDHNNYRMGRGKAYYDNFLSKYSGFKMGVCFSLQYVNRVPVEDHDIAMDAVVYG